MNRLPPGITTSPPWAAECSLMTVASAALGAVARVEEATRTIARPTVQKILKVIVFTGLWCGRNQVCGAGVYLGEKP